jgi:hypothetical protein
MTDSATDRRPVICEVFPYLCVRDAASAIEFSDEIKQRFDAEQRA